MDRAEELDSYSYEDYIKITQNSQERVELIDGYIYMMAGASAEHQDTLLNIAVILRDLSKNRRCKPRVAPYDLKIELNGDINIVQPDIMLFCNEQKLPCAIFEILSPSTAYKDRKAKYFLYERAGIKEYYIVDPIMKIVEKFVLIDGEYRFNGAYGGEDNIKLECIEGSLNIEDIFDL